MVATEGALQRDTDLLRGVLDMTVLALIATEPGHAYAIVERVRSRGLNNVGYGTIYPLVTRLRRQGLLTQQPAPSSQGPGRKLLTITASGREALVQWRERWDHVTASVASVLNDLDRLSSDDER